MRVELVEYGLGPFLITDRDHVRNPDLPDLLFDLMQDFLDGLSEFTWMQMERPDLRGIEYSLIGVTWKVINGQIPGQKDNSLEGRRCAGNPKIPAV